MRKSWNPGLRGALFCLVLATLAGFAVTAAADPFSTPIVDGHLAGDWSTADLVVDDTADDNLQKLGNMSELWLTWDADSLYVGLYYQAHTRSVVVYLDAGLDQGPAGAAALAQFPRGIVLPEGRTIDLMLARSHTAFSDTTGVLKAWRAAADGSLTEITSRTHNVDTWSTDLPSKRFYWWFSSETAIPWSAIYPDGVPARAVLGAVALVTPSEAGAGADDTAPGAGRTELVPTPLQLMSLHNSVLDVDGDGTIDPANAAASGTLTLPQDPLNIPVTVTATLQDWTGQALGGPLSRVVTRANVREYTLGRLPAGTYLLQASAPGYFPATDTVTVGESQVLTGVDFTLEKATTITGTLALELGQALGGYEFRAPDGSVLAGGPLLPSAFPFHFTFYVSDSGTYTLTAWAANHLRTEFPLAVTAGEDLTALSLTVPRAPRIAGAVSFNTGPGAAGTIQLANAAGDTIFATAPFTPGSPAFSFYAPRLGALVLRAAAPTYALFTEQLTAVAGVDLPGLDVALARLPLVHGSLAFADGPGHAGDLILTGPAGADTLAFGAAGGVFDEGGAVPPFFVAGGEYTLRAEADGYALWSTALSVPAVPDSRFDAGELLLAAVRADRLRLLDADGEPVLSVAATVSIPAEDFYSYARLHLEAVDADGRRDLFDLDDKLGALPLTARKLDDVAAPRGFARFLASEDVDDIVTVADLSAGEAVLWVANDAVEVLRLFVGPDVPDPLKQVTPPTARFMVGFNDPRPATVVLTAARDTLAADGVSTLLIDAQLYDSAGNTSRLPDIPVTFNVSAASTGAGAFTVPTAVTNAEGLARAELRATGAGVLQIACAVTVNNEVLTVLPNSLDDAPGTLPVFVTAGPTASWRLQPATRLGGLVSGIPVTAQLVDAYGNPTGRSGVSIAFTATPAALGGFTVTATASDAQGRAQTVFTPAGAAGIVELDGVSPAYPVDAEVIELRDVAVVTDPASADEPDAHNSFPPMDLTALVLDNSPEELLLEVPFSTDWGGVQLHVLIETEGDAAGGSRDPFEMPVNYGHVDRPDFVLTSKYSANDYGDFRRWVAGGWQFWDLANEVFSADDTVDKNIQPLWVTIGAETVRIAIPFAALGGTPASLRCEIYLTQEDGVKRSAFDSAPSDATLDLDFDYGDPQPGDWDVAVQPVTLTQWSDAYVVKTDFPTPPTLSRGVANPDTLDAGAVFTLSTAVADAGDGIGDVLADLSAIGGSALARLFDDGASAHGDAAAGDGVYSLRTTVPPGSPGGVRLLQILAYDATNRLAGRETIPVLINAQVEIIRSETDPAGDDHGPDIPGNDRLYYTYPTNSVFVPGAFDLLGLDIYETTAVVGGAPVAMIAFDVTVGDFPDPADPQTADWNPQYGDLNIQKLDILIDSAPGGTTAGLPNRRLDVAAWNGWDFAVIMDGWYKALIPSLGLNTVDAWRENALRNDRDIQIVGNFDTDHIVALVSKEALGNPTVDDVRGWNLAVLVSSHDFGGEEVLGGIRWVNESRSEWNFGGGHYTDRDANVIDLLLAPGAGRTAGRPQQEILDYTTPLSQDRLNAGLTPCVMDMTAFEDTGPPAIRIVRNHGEVVRRAPLREAPIAYTLEIVDDYQVAEATFRYRPTIRLDGWNVETPMGYLGDDLWSVDIPSAWLDDNLVVSPVDQARYLEFQVVAVDASGKTTVSPVTTMQVDPAADSLWISGTLEAELVLRHVDGSSITVGEQLRNRLVQLYRETSGTTLPADTLATLVSLGWEIRQVDEAVRNAPVTPDGRFIGTARTVSLDLGWGEDAFILDGRLPAPYALKLRYAEGSVEAGAAEKQIGVYEYHAATGRWVLVGGHVNTGGNEVTVNVDHAGTFGLFRSADLEYDESEVISGVVISPNPFSPNADGLYDQCTISFYLSKEASVTVEIYNIDGKLKRRLQETYFYEGDAARDPQPQRVGGIIWDGTDENGKYVPYGIYFVRILATHKAGGSDQMTGSNHSLAVIR